MALLCIHNHESKRVDQDRQSGTNMAGGLKHKHFDDEPIGLMVVFFFVAPDWENV